MNRIIEHSSSLEKALMTYRNHADYSASCEEVLQEIGQLNNRIQEVEEPIQDSMETSGRWFQKQEMMELEFVSLQATLREYESIMDEDKTRIENLCEECSSLSSRMNEENEVLEKYKTGYVNMKKRLEVMEKNVEIIPDTELEAWSGCLWCISVCLAIIYS